MNEELTEELRDVARTAMMVRFGRDKILIEAADEIERLRRVVLDQTGQIMGSARVERSPAWPVVTACGSLDDPAVVITFPDGKSAVYACIAGRENERELWSRINERDMLSTDAVAQSAGDAQAPPPAGAVEQPGRERLEVRSLSASTPSDSASNEREQREVEVLRVQRDQAIAVKDNIFRTLMGIYNLMLYPPDTKLEDGRVMRFDPPDSPMYRESYRLLCERIRSIMEDVRAAGVEPVVNMQPAAFLVTGDRYNPSAWVTKLEAECSVASRGDDAAITPLYARDDAPVVPRHAEPDEDDGAIRESWEVCGIRFYVTLSKKHLSVLASKPEGILMRDNIKLPDDAPKMARHDLLRRLELELREHDSEYKHITDPALYAEIAGILGSAPKVQGHRVEPGAEHCGDPLCELCSPEDLRGSVSGERKQ